MLPCRKPTHRPPVHQITPCKTQASKKIANERKTQENRPLYHQPSTAFVYCAGLGDHKRLVVYSVRHRHSRKNPLDDRRFRGIYRISLAAHLARKNSDVCDRAGPFETVVPQRSKDPCGVASVLPKGKGRLQNGNPKKAERRSSKGAARIMSVKHKGGRAGKSYCNYDRLAGRQGIAPLALGNQ